MSSNDHYHNRLSDEFLHRTHNFLLPEYDENEVNGRDDKERKMWSELPTRFKDWCEHDYKYLRALGELLTASHVNAAGQPQFAAGGAGVVAITAFRAGGAHYVNHLANTGPTWHRDPIATHRLMPYDPRRMLHI